MYVTSSDEEFSLLLMFFKVFHPFLLMQGQTTTSAVYPGCSESVLHNLYHLDLSRCPLLHKKFATSTLISAPLKSVTVEYLEQVVTCLNERVFIKTMYHLLTNCSQSILLAMVCRLSLLVLNTSLAKCEGLCYAIQ